MLYLNTKTDTLTTPQIRKIVHEVIQWSKKNVGTKRKINTLKFLVSKRAFSGELAYGQYDPNKNLIKVNRETCHNVKHIVRVTLHEYCHFLQDLRAYSRLLDEVGYNNHPQEKEARVMETMYSICWKDIKNKL